MEISVAFQFSICCHYYYFMTGRKFLETPQLKAFYATLSSTPGVIAGHLLWHDCYLSPALLQVAYHIWNLHNSPSSEFSHFDKSDDPECLEESS